MKNVVRGSADRVVSSWQWKGCSHIAERDGDKEEIDCDGLTLFRVANIEQVLIKNFAPVEKHLQMDKGSFVFALHIVVEGGGLSPFCHIWS